MISGGISFNEIRSSVNMNGSFDKSLFCAAGRYPKEPAAKFHMLQHTWPKRLRVEDAL